MAIPPIPNHIPPIPGAPKPPAPPRASNRIAHRKGQIWERWPGEAEDVFWFFKCYRDCAYPKGPSGPWVRRSIPSALRLALSRGADPETLPAPATLRTYATRYQWDTRVRSYDLFLDQTTEAVTLDELSRTQRAQVRRLAKLASLVEGELDRHEARLAAMNEAGEAITITTLRETAQILESLDKMERLERGAPTAVEHVTHTIDPDRMEEADLLELETLARKYANT